MFERYDVTRTALETQLGRALKGNPSAGELAVLAALNAHDPEGVRRLLRRSSASLGADFVAVIERLLVRRPDRKPVVVTLSRRAYDRYTASAEARGLTLSAVLEEALEGHAAVRPADLQRAAADLTRRAELLGEPELLASLEELSAALSLMERAR